MRVYIASFFDTRDRLRPIVDLLEAMGAPRGHEPIIVTSRWIKNQELANPTERDFAGYAQRDLEDIQAADLVIVDTFDETPRGGREVELGYALGIGRRAVVVGPRRNVFHRLVPGYDDWFTLIRVLHNEQHNG